MGTFKPKARITVSGTADPLTILYVVRGAYQEDRWRVWRTPGRDDTLYYAECDFEISEHSENHCIIEVTLRELLGPTMLERYCAHVGQLAFIVATCKGIDVNRVESTCFYELYGGCLDPANARAYRDKKEAEDATRKLERTLNNAPRDDHR